MESSPGHETVELDIHQTWKLDLCHTRHKNVIITCDLSGEGAARYVLIVKLDNDVIVSWSCGQVGHGAGAVFVVFAGDLGLRGTFHRQRQTA